MGGRAPGAPPPRSANAKHQQRMVNIIKTLTLLPLTIFMTYSTYYVCVYSHCTDPGPGIGTRKDQYQWVIISCRNVHTGLRQGNGPEPICVFPILVLNLTKLDESDKII